MDTSSFLLVAISVHPASFVFVYWHCSPLLQGDCLYSQGKLGWGRPNSASQVALSPKG